MQGLGWAARTFLWIGSAAFFAVPAAALDAAAVKAETDAFAAQRYPALFELYKGLHANPDLGFQEARTAAKLAKEMRALGFEVTEGVGRTGVVAIYKNGEGPTVLVRTELDGLPMEEKTGLPYASRAKQTWRGAETFVAHSCGHDIHMTAWIGTAEALLAMKDKWHGTLMFIAQPNEEQTSQPGGASAMIADGLFKKWKKPDLGFALHDWPEAAGTVSYRAGPTSSTADALEITFTGRGGHGSKPEVTIDPVVMASRFVNDVQTVISREKDPFAFGVVTVGSIQAGSAGNIIPDMALLRGTVRSFDDGVREKLLAGIRRTADGVAAIAGAPKPAIKFEGSGKAMVNDAALTARTAAVFKAAFGANASERQPITASEDYSEFIIAGVPSTYFFIGMDDPKKMAEAKAKGEPRPNNHSPFFAPVPEPTIKTGVAAMTLAVLNVMAK
ncbi:MAG: amidohydrolase [Alphaproteobacteria bacterium]